ncbi:MAG TPA: acyl-CoA dehydrogenase family protein, partial [Blastocatellia bacterium]|nr:acyl-CoA dehydrogenase family protein [Blastocatellia bacterium]
MAYILNEEERLILATVKKFLDKEVAPVASELEHHNEYPTEIVEGMKKLGLFGANIPEQYGGLDLSYTVFAMIFEEISRVWMGLAGILGTHCVLADVISRFGTEEQKRRFLPIMTTGEKRGAICLSEPHAG